MRLSRISPLVVAASALALFGAAALASDARPIHEVRGETGAAALELPATIVVTEDGAEIARIRAHFDSVLSELAATPAPGGTALKVRARAELLVTLRAYRDRGAFPHNYDFPARAVPYFVDRKTGVLCAVAHLLSSTGRRDIVDRVASANNNVLVAELAGDTAFVRWLDANGITLDEAARIQVPYMPGNPPQPVIEPEPRRRASGAALVAAPAAIGSIAFGLVNGLANANGHRRAARVAGFASGIVSAGLGAALMTRPDERRGVGMASAAVGGLSIALAARATRRYNSYLARERETERGRAAMQATLSPIVGANGGGAGLSLSITY